MNTYEAWSTGRPIYSRLPDSYKENNVADHITSFWDQLLVDYKAKVDDLPRQLDPTNCDASWLDFLAPLCGFYGEYWDTNWPEDSKRLLLANSYTLIWKDKGSREALSFILSALHIDHKIWEGNGFILGTSQLGIDTLGTAAWQYKILLPKKYKPNSYEFQLANKINRLHGPLWCESEVIYEHLIL
ncbi:phage tail protein [Picosynechococcus sp. PCC 7117]|uniref:phage tail protein n=1 Tax=Picosynechococcus sp. PCC 7117 TaxID=195498 RepID=UPI000810EF51|nr:phage tail protein [Picosynechococcus sp. PCC 7117]ANV88504.1 hypothetical protein AWQ22_14110 [Picosynechococcus sp. PCC 7117]